MHDEHPRYNVILRFLLVSLLQKLLQGAELMRRCGSFYCLQDDRADLSAEVEQPPVGTLSMSMVSRIRRDQRSSCISQSC